MVKPGKQGANSESEMEGLSQVSVNRTILHSVVSIRLISESRFGKRLRMLVYTTDSSSVFALGCAPAERDSYGGRGITFSEA